eukprot:CAMPEP_0175095994 /NCGR_PEP_ID=MMETSP0086_2-20121207/4478_1 /TAXON_ID=136419 /ORGANISM="Unknown Unknown, Strain D1" /LENGTH=414 /DNA_ID=CAMNT_0016369331 /DNA_START=70 /DNA_END=1314 /DNA_ORIENTATION=-
MTESEARMQALQAETKQMEDRLAMLRVAMAGEKSKWETVPRTKEGTFWKSARNTDGKNFAKLALEKANRPRNRKPGAQPQSKSAKAQTKPPRPSSDKQHPVDLSLGGSSIGSSSKRTPIVYDTGPGVSHSASVGTEEPAAAGSLLNGTFDEKAGSNSFQEAREQFLKENRLFDLPSTNTASHSASSTNETNQSSGAPGSLLDGTFDETQSSSSFQEARKQWLAETKPSVQLSYSTTNSSSSSASNTKQVTAGSLLEGSYNEEENRRAFAEARKAFLQGQSKLEESKQIASTWNVDLSQTDPSRPLTASGKKARTKTACYQCYKLFFSDVALSLDQETDQDKLFCTEKCLGAYKDAAAAIASKISPAVINSARKSSSRLSKQEPTPIEQPVVRSRPASGRPAQPAKPVISFPDDD